MTTQVLFVGDTTPSKADLDANIKASFGFLQLINYPSYGTYAAHTGSDTKGAIDSSFNLEWRVGNIQIINTGSILVKGSGGLGYGSGAGGTVTQATSKSTGVTLNKASGQITMNNAALAAGAVVNFSFTNSTIGTTDIVHCAVAGGVASDGNYSFATHSAVGGATISVRNVSGGSLSEAVVIQFIVLKGVTA